MVSVKCFYTYTYRLYASICTKERKRKEKERGTEGEGDERGERRKERVYGKCPIGVHRQVHRPYTVKRPYEVDSHSRSTINAGRFARASPNFHARSYYERLRLGATPQETGDEGSPPATRTKKGFVFRGYPRKLDVGTATSR